MSQMTWKKVPRVKAKPTMPMMPDVREKGEVAVVDTTTPIVMMLNLMEI